MHWDDQNGGRKWIKKVVFQFLKNDTLNASDLLHKVTVILV